MIYQIPFISACILIALSYTALKLKSRLDMERYESVSAPLLTGLACIILLLEPFSSITTSASLSFAPIVMAGLRYGWLVSLSAALLPAVFIFQTAGDHTWVRIAQDLIVPALVSSLYHRKENESGYSFIPYLDGVKICVILTVVRLVINGLFQKQASFYFFADHLQILLLSVLAMLVLIAMYNDENRTWMLQRRLELQANQDGLTGLPNLRSFMNMASEAARLRPVSIMMIDIDNFKKYNDTFGHLQGDRLLREVGQILRSTIHEYDYVARYGGEEFIMMSQVTDYSQLSVYAERLCLAVATHQSTSLEASGPTISIGICTTSTQSYELLKMISEADEALYFSKNSGKNRYTFYSDMVRTTAKNA